MTGPEKTGFGARDGFGVAAVVAVLAAGVFVVLWVQGAWRWAIRQAPDLMVDWPGGPWLFGVMAGLLAVAGVYGGLWASDNLAGSGTPRRLARNTATAVCWALPAALTLYFISALPARRCSSDGPTCDPIEGVGPAVITYAVTAAAAGFALYRARAARAERRRAEHQARLRKLRKKGKGKSRAAR
ncbi:hypothetical protein ACIBKX_13585 [Streptomyces sp. NPDC050658]|uniref:hypothetical protein n=1 Tax=unclassified Streptomyces TaxID=2593676 RepID=UPI003429743F